MRVLLPLRLVRAGHAGHALRHGRRRDRGRHPRQVPPPRRQLRQPRRSRSTLHTPEGTCSRSAPDRTPSCSGRRPAAWASPASSPRRRCASSRSRPSMIRVDTERGPRPRRRDGRACSDGDAEYRYSVAWIDCLAPAASLGRSVLSRGDHATLDELPTRKRAARPPVRAAARSLPRRRGRRTAAQPLDASTAFNELWFRAAPRARARPHPVDRTVLPSARRGERLEPRLRQPRLRPVPVRRAVRRRRRPCGGRSSG